MKRSHEILLSVLSLTVLSLLFAIALLTTIIILPFVIIVGAVFSIKEMVKWHKKQANGSYTIGKHTFVQDPLSVRRVIEITFPKRGFKRAG